MKTAEQIEDYCRRHHYSEQYAKFWMRHRSCAVMGCYAPSGPPHHWRTRGAGGDDSPLNLGNLCRAHHTEFHSVGRETFCDRHPEMRAQIEAALERPREVKV